MRNKQPNERTLKIELFSQWKLEAEFRKFLREVDRRLAFWIGCFWIGFYVCICVCVCLCLCLRLCLYLLYTCARGGCRNWSLDGVGIALNQAMLWPWSLQCWWTTKDVERSASKFSKKAKLIQPSLQLRFHLMHALEGEVEVLKVADRCLAPVHSKAHLSLVTNLILVANGVSVNNFTHSV